jgi:hypothetical protein
MQGTNMSTPRILHSGAGKNVVLERPLPLAFARLGSSGSTDANADDPADASGLPPAAARTFFAYWPPMFPFLFVLKFRRVNYWRNQEIAAPKITYGWYSQAQSFTGAWGKLDPSMVSHDLKAQPICSVSFHTTSDATWSCQSSYVGR